MLALALALALAVLPASCQDNASLPAPPARPGEAPWTIVRSASLASDAQSVWSTIGDPGVFLKVAFKHITYSVESSYRGSSTFIVELPSGEEFFLDLKSTNETNRYHHFLVGGHTAGIFDGPSIEGSELFISITEASDNTFVNPVFSVAEVGWLADVSPKESEEKVNAVMDGLLRVQLDNLRVEFGAADCFDEGRAFHRSVSGVCNNMENVAWGTAFSPLRRLPVYDPLYADGRSAPSGTDISARFISNALCDAHEDDPDRDDARNEHLATDIFVFFGQFIDHDLDLSPTGLLGDSHQPLFTGGSAKFHDKMPIPVPLGDEFMPELRAMDFERAAWVREDNEAVTPRQHLNRLSSYLDLSQLYGTTHIRAGVLRAKSGGLLRTSAGDLLPFNGDGGPDSVGLSLANDPDASPEFYVGGDVRANENILLTSQHVLWLREHNRVAGALSQAFPEYGDEELFNTARAIVIAEYQSIIYNEWLPRLLGPGALPASEYEYDFTVDPSISTFFSTAAFRFGHSMVNKFLWVAADANSALGTAFGPTPTKTVPLRDAFFSPQAFRDAGTDGILLGAAWHLAPALDVKIVDDLRNFLFANLNDSPGQPNKDLAAFNIQRGRDMGLPPYNKAREAFGMAPVRSFAEITGDGRVARLLEEVYVEVDNVDAFIGGLAEEPVPGAMLGPLFFAAIEDQFKRLRDGDRLFYKNVDFGDELLQRYPPLQAVLEDRVTLADVISNNTNIPAAALTRADRTSVFDLKGLDPKVLVHSQGRRMLEVSS
ncbi:unnamed protein product [Ostreobium quekettii]|uniref:Peroxidase n=1 Tax=Ostreobium quekettii TaxID=121088 RepID=A0A8S1J175_9CHLO|nr:unnamed protein product [Ostreobium quekettii]